ncbi:cAMP-binding domain of CRP or a regulatory subunit of cAMP-dependent protein kinases [Rhizobium sp. NFR07]|uniref:Crp/Fnr family transcriptional regulator n=1 Tax=Rhizobium sp. NFR07 TaxID=1566262 RepID=UPI0008EFFF1B|nr:Crp/Fnr family transcriptional regulator [Rhizobium sp. NFR07]SFB48296.1 cAMP-binding domain of CRP or a regulatory subunit of cAMP-dependent protein kinases [Rhizobium sp. NFR07]
MGEIRQAAVRNNLLRLVSAESFDAIAKHLEFLELPRGFELSEPHEEADYAYFPESGIASIVARSPQGQHAEIGIFGRDGMTPATVVLDAGTDPYSIFMQVQGEGYRVRASILKQMLDEDAAVRVLLGRYAQALSVQGAYTSLSNAVHHIDERLARWILMCHDRTDGDEISLTHEFLSIMLAVRRPSVTTALHMLEGRKLIYSERGMIIVRDRPALEQFANDAYGECEREYFRLIGPFS